MKGTVYKSTGSWYTVKSFNGTFYECRLKGKFRIGGIKSTNPVAVGDRVVFEVETKGDQRCEICSQPPEHVEARAPECGRGSVFSHQEQKPSRCPRAGREEFAEAVQEVRVHGRVPHHDYG